VFARFLSMTCLRSLFRQTGEHSSPLRRNSVRLPDFPRLRPSSGPSGHLLPRGKKGIFARGAPESHDSGFQIKPYFFDGGHFFASPGVGGGMAAPDRDNPKRPTQTVTNTDVFPFARERKLAPCSRLARFPWAVGFLLILLSKRNALDFSGQCPRAASGRFAAFIQTASGRNGALL
jgi:hypothetical protein